MCAPSGKVFGLNSGPSSACQSTCLTLVCQTACHPTIMVENALLVNNQPKETHL